MSTKRMLGITAFGILFIAAAIGVMLLTSFLRHDNDEIRLPAIVTPPENIVITQPDILDSVDVNRYTIQAIISTLSPRPEVYSRNIIVENHWEGGYSVTHIGVSVYHRTTSLRIQPPFGVERRVIITDDEIYIWYSGDRYPFIGKHGSTDDDHRVSDEFQMLLTFEDILMLEIDDIIEAGYAEYDGEICVFAVYLTPAFRHRRTYYVSLELGLVIAAREYDANGVLVYRMTTDETIIGEIDHGEFLLPDGTGVLKN